MALVSEMKKVFGRAGEIALEGRSMKWLSTPVVELVELGYPGVYQGVIFLTAAGRARWISTRQLLFDDRCCVCGVPTERRVDYRPLLLFARLRWRQPIISGIPNCELHKCQSVGIVARVHDAGQRYISVVLRSRNQSFVDETRARSVKDGDYEPPWVVFPKRRPDMSWNQGTDAFWMRSAWEPFWSDKPIAERAAYLGRWNAPQEWREALLAGAP